MKHLVCVAVCALAVGFVRADAYVAIEQSVAASDAALDAAQAALTDACVVTDYAHLVTRVNGTNVWTAALQAAVAAHEIVRIPASERPYYVDATVRVPSNRASRRRARRWRCCRVRAS